MQRQTWTWTPARLRQPARLARWGHYGTPVLIFPTAGGDFEEIERFQLVAALTPLIDGGRIKVYSIDGTAARAWLAATTPPQDCARLQENYDAFVYEDVLQRIRQDCQNDHLEPILAGSSLGAAAAMRNICLHADSFRAAIGLSIVYDFSSQCSATTSQEIATESPLTCLSASSAAQLERLRHRTIILGTGEGDYENPAASKRLSDAFASKGIACRLTLWGPASTHSWSSWRERLPPMLAEAL
jgi:esterase/lipase superfamily enzyme